MRRIKRPSASTAIVHTHSSKAGIVGRWAAYLAGIPVIIHTYHGFGFNDYQNLFRKWFYIYLERFTALITTKFIAVSKRTLRQALMSEFLRKRMLN